MRNPFSRRKSHPMHKQLKDYKKAKKEAEIEAAYQKAYHQARIREARKRGSREGSRGKYGLVKGLGSAMGDIQELMIGKNFEIGPTFSRPKTSPKPRATKPQKVKLVQVGGKIYQVETPKRKKQQKKPKQKRNDLWDLI